MANHLTRCWWMITWFNPLLGYQHPTLLFGDLDFHLLRQLRIFAMALNDPLFPINSMALFCDLWRSKKRTKRRQNVAWIQSCECFLDHSMAHQIFHFGTVVLATFEFLIVPHIGREMGTNWGVKVAKCYRCRHFQNTLEDSKWILAQVQKSVVCFNISRAAKGCVNHAISFR